MILILQKEVTGLPKVAQELEIEPEQFGSRVHALNYYTMLARIRRNNRATLYALYWKPSSNSRNGHKILLLV